MQCCSCSVFTVCATCNVISPVKYVLYFYISTSRSLCAVPNMAVVCCSLISCFPGMVLRYCLQWFWNGSSRPYWYRYQFYFLYTIIIIYLTTLSVAKNKQRRLTGRLTNNELSRMWKESDSLNVSSGMWLDVLTNSMEAPLRYLNVMMFQDTSQMCYDLVNLVTLLLLLLLLLSPLCRVFIHIFLRQTMSLRNTMLQPFCRYCLWCPYH
jgi:hypothetical protein